MLNVTLACADLLCCVRCNHSNVQRMKCYVHWGWDCSLTLMLWNGFQSTLGCKMCKIKVGDWIVQTSSWHAALVISRCCRLRGKRHKEQRCDWIFLGALGVIESSRYPSSGWRMLSAAPKCCVKFNRAGSKGLLVSIRWWKCLPVLNLCLQMWHSDRLWGKADLQSHSRGSRTRSCNSISSLFLNHIKTICLPRCLSKSLPRCTLPDQAHSVARQQQRSAGSTNINM